MSCKFGPKCQGLVSGVRRKKAVLSIATKLQIVQRAKNGESVSNLSSKIKLHDIAPIRVFVNF